MKSHTSQFERIAEQLAFIARTLKNIDNKSFLPDEVVQHTVSMALITIGECANHLSNQFKETNSTIE